MGNCLGIQFIKLKQGARTGLKLLWKDKENVAVEIDDSAEEHTVDVSDDSSNEDWVVVSKSNEGYRPLKNSQESKKKKKKKKKKGHRITKDVVEECFAPLTDEEEALVSGALSYSYRREVLVSHPNCNIDITGENLMCLSPGGWLNDDVINLYLVLLKEREERESHKFLKCHFFNTFFYKKLISGGGYNFQSVRKWTTQKKLGYSLLDCDKIFVPIHQGAHWCLAIINKKDKKFEYLDSLKGFDMQVLPVLAKYYVDEVKDKNKEDVDITSWKAEFVTEHPEQENGFDCGVFMIKYVDFYSRDVGLCFDQRDMPYFRRRTAKEILKLRAE
ncbi:hypothetical protein ABFS83_14G008500 [Erythranthe nasuta]